MASRPFHRLPHRHFWSSLDWHRSVSSILRDNALSVCAYKLSVFLGAGFCSVELVPPHDEVRDRVLVRRLPNVVRAGGYAPAKENASCDESKNPLPNLGACGCKQFHHHLVLCLVLALFLNHHPKMPTTPTRRAREASHIVIS
jgi:hypothetical protein